MVSVVRSVDISAIIILNIKFEEDIFQKGGFKGRYTPGKSHETNFYA